MTAPEHAPEPRSLRSALRRFRRDRRGNVLMILGFSILPLTFATGMGIDYSRAMKLQTKLNAAADAAALSAVTSTAMTALSGDACKTVRNMFVAQSQNLSGLEFDPTDPKQLIITITDKATAADLGSTTVCSAQGGSSNTTAIYSRSASVSYRGKSDNAFAGILGLNALTIHGASQAYSAVAPNINFYLVLDTSPSMLLPATSTGLSLMRDLTHYCDPSDIGCTDPNKSLPNGCAFACHTQNPWTDKIHVRYSSSYKRPDKSGTLNVWLDSSNNGYMVDKISNNQVYSSLAVKNGQLVQTDPRGKGASVAVGTFSTGHYADTFWLAHNYGVFPGGSAITLRLDDEQEAAQQLVPFAQQTAKSNNVTYKLALYSFDYQNPKSLTSLNDVQNMTTASIPNLSNLQAYWYQNSQISQGNNIDDRSTDFASMFTSLNAAMPAPGTGKTANDPKEVMFIITDGMSDETLNGSRTHRELQPTHIAQCTAIKNRGIRIAILYTEYLPDSLTGDTWSQNNVAPYLPNVEPALKQCASTNDDGSPLYYKVTTDQSIPAALNALFSQVVATARLTQ